MRSGGIELNEFNEDEIRELFLDNDFDFYVSV